MMSSEYFRSSEGRNDLELLRVRVFRHAEAGLGQQTHVFSQGQRSVITCDPKNGTLYSLSLLDVCAQRRERLERGACHGGLEFVDLRSGVNVALSFVSV